MLSKGLVTEKTAANGSKKYVVVKTENPTTKKQSTINTDFSSEHWNGPTLVLFENVKALGLNRFQKIFDDVSSKIGPRRGRGGGNIITNDTKMEDELLQSESSSDGDDALVSDPGDEEQIGDEE